MGSTCFNFDYHIKLLIQLFLIGWDEGLVGMCQG